MSAAAEGEASRPQRGASLRGAGPAAFEGGSGGIGTLPTAAAAMNPGALRGAAQGRDLDSLAHTLFLRIYPVIGLVLLITQCAIAFINYEDTVRIRTDQAASLARVTADTIARPRWMSDPSSLRALRAVTAAPDVRRAVLRDAAGRVIAVQGEEVSPKAWGMITVAAPIAPDGQAAPEGSLTLFVLGEDFRSFAQHQALLAMAAILILKLAFVVTLQLNVRRHVLGPLQRLLAAMREVERKSWTHVELSGRHRPSNEIDSVCLAFNRMVDGLQSGDEAKQLLARLEETHGKLEQANRLVMESLGYARRIQGATLPEPGALAGSGLEVGVLWEPLQMVGGDYYWMEEVGGRSIIIVADCTGHGIPGAFLSLIVATALEHILHVEKLYGPAEILAALDGRVRTRLRQDGRCATSDDGVECGICVWDRAAGDVVFAGAGLSLTYSEGGAAHRIRGAKRGLGFASRRADALNLEEVRIPANAGTTFFLMTDGVSDQMGSPSPGQRRLLGHAGLGEILVRHRELPVPDQMAALKDDLARYRGAEKARDDMTVVAFRRAS